MDLNEIESFLDIEIGDKRLRNGKKRKNKNQYYYFQDQYYIVKLTRDKWFIADDSKKTRRLLRLHCWHFNSEGYTQTNYDGSSKKWHQFYLNYENGLCCDHINNKKYDNRSENLRIVTHRQNSRNLSKRFDNTSGKQGIFRRTLNKGKCHYWRVKIIDNEGKQLEKLFSINKYGEAEAKRLAIEKRLEWEREYNYIGD